MIQFVKSLLSPPTIPAWENELEMYQSVLHTIEDIQTGDGYEIAEKHIELFKTRFPNADATMLKCRLYERLKAIQMRRV